MSQAFHLNPRTTTSRIQSPATLVKRRPSSMQNSLVQTDSAQRVTGHVSEKEARQRQMLKYCEDKVKFIQKEKEKADKKRAEKFEKYKHVDMGQKLQDGNEEQFTSQLEQPQHDRSSLNVSRLEQEREEIRAKRDVKQREERVKKYTQVTTGERLTQESRAAPATFTSLSPENVDRSSNTEEDKKKKEEEFRKQMRAARERMQNIYNKTVAEQ